MPPPASPERYGKRREKNKNNRAEWKSCIDRHNNYDVRWTQSPVIQTGKKEWKGIEAWNSVPSCGASNVTGELDGGLYPLIMWKLCSAQVTISSESDGGPNPLIIVKCDLMTSYTCCWTRTSPGMHITEYIGLYDAVMPRCVLPGIHEPCSASMNPLPPSPAAYIMTSTGQSPTLDIVILYRHNLPILSSPRNIRFIFPVVCEWLQCASGTREQPYSVKVGIANLNPSSVASENWWNSE